MHLHDGKQEVALLEITLRLSRVGGDANTEEEQMGHIIVL